MMGVGAAKITYSACTQTNKTAHMPNDQLHSADAFSDVPVAQRLLSTGCMPGRGY